MEKNQLDQFDMLQNVENLFNDNPTLWAGNVPVTNAKTGLSSRVADIAAQYAIQLIVTTGAAKNKENARKKLEKEMFVVSSAVCNYANGINDELLYDKCYVAKSTLSDLHADTLTGRCADLVLDANNVIASLLPYGITAATITTLTASSVAFSGLKQDPQNAIDTRKKATQKIAELLPEAMSFMERNMDTAMVSLEASEETFYGIYQNARAINNSGTTTISLTTLCVDSVTQVPIEGVELVVVSINEQRTSPASGVNIFKNLPAGEDKMQLDHPLYLQQVVDYTLVNNQTTELVFSLVHK